MKRLASLLMALFVFSSSAFAGPVIYSTCPSPITDNQDGATADIYPHSSVKRYIRFNTKALLSLYSGFHYLKNASLGPSEMKEENRKERRQVDAWINDNELNGYLTDPSTDCHSSDRVNTIPYAIYPFALKVAGGEPQRFRFKLCEYQVTADSQIPYDAPCRILGDEKGYTSAQLRYRAANLGRLSAELHDFTDGIIEIAGSLVSVAVFHRFFTAKMFNFPIIVAGSTPVTSAFVGTKLFNWSDSLLSEFLEFKDSEEIALKGNLATAIAIDRPMQDFAPYFEKYLNSINDVAPAPLMSSVEVPVSK